MSAVLLLAALILAPVIGGGFGELTNGILQILAFGGIVFYLLLPRKHSGTWARVPGLIPIAIFTLAIIASTITTHAIYPSLKQILFLAASLGAYALSASLCRDKKIAAGVVWGLMASALIISMLGIRDYAVSSGGGPAFWKALLSSGEHQRLFGPFLNPNFFSGFLVMVLPISLVIYLVTRKTVLAILAGMAFTFELMALMLTGAKFGIVAAVAALLMFFLLAIATKSLRRAKFVRLLVIAPVVVALLILFSAPVRTRIEAAEAGGSQVHSTQFRVYTWQATWDMIMDSPWTGFGPGTYDITYPRYTIAGVTKHAHNSYLQIMADSGLIAGLAFLALLFAIAYRALICIARGSTQTHASQRDAGDESGAASEAITWRDLVPHSAWRLMNCALFAALVGSAIRSLVDSDWYVIGISLPFWVLAGVLVSECGAAENDIAPKRSIKYAAVGVCTILILLSISFGLGDMFSARGNSLVESNRSDITDIIRDYRYAAAVSPLNPEYHRQLGMYLGLGNGDVEAAEREMDTAIKLAPNTSEGGWYAKAMLAAARQDWSGAVAGFSHALDYSPKSTDALYQLAQAYAMDGDNLRYEATLRRLLAIENTPYEQTKGTPEIIDTTFARAHAYFGKKYLTRKQYSRAKAEFQVAIDRLVIWEKGRKLQRFTGTLSPEAERQLLETLRNCYYGLADACTALGNKPGAEEAKAKAAHVKVPEP